MMDRVHARQPLRIEQASKDDLCDRTSSVIRAEEVSRTRLKRLRIDVAIFVLHEIVPDSGRNLHLTRTQGFEAESKNLTLSLRIPDLDRFLPVSSERRRNLGAAHGVDRRCQRITMEK